jgi:subtilase family serine protease
LRHRKLAATVGFAAVLALPGTALAAPGRYHHMVCPAPKAGHATCFAEVVTRSPGAHAKPLAESRAAAAAATPSGYGPADLRAAYKLTSNGSSTQTVAIVDAYDDPTAASDLSTYRSQYGLPACTTSSGCFRKLNQAGGTSPPAVDGGWAQEISLDLDMASAICPNCKILLVEANSSSLNDLAASVDTAVAKGGTVVSNSYGGSEFSGETTFGSHYNHTGVPITVSSGDSGYGVQFPAALSTVTAVGGTSLRRNSGTTRGWTETVWSGAGSGCSRYVAKPSWQHDPGCARRTVADVAADANPSTGVAVYDSTPYQGASGWMVFGGTSVAAPIVAGVYAVAGNRPAAGFEYSHTASLFDVTSGSNGTCSPSYLCHGATGYDGPTGLGTPNGTGAF